MDGKLKTEVLTFLKPLYKIWSSFFVNLLCASSSSRASGLCRTVAISISSSTVSAKCKRQKGKAQQEMQDVEISILCRKKRKLDDIILKNGFHDLEDVTHSFWIYRERVFICFSGCIKHVTAVMIQRSGYYYRININNNRLQGHTWHIQ